MTRLQRMALVALFALAFMVPAVAAPTPVPATKTWSGSVENAELQKLAPEGSVLVKAEDFEKLVKAWKVADKAPPVDFDKELVLVATSVGSRLSLKAMLDEKGDLTALGLGTRDFGPGFRYVIITVPRAGVKTVNGKPLPQ